MKNIICKIFNHKWEYDKYLKDFSCKRGNICRRCGLVNEKKYEYHNWKDWVQSTNSCVEKRQCKRCDKIDERQNHHWGEWKEVESDLCSQIRSCQNNNCKETSERKNHHWGNWDNSTRECQKCGKTERCEHPKMDIYEREEIESYTFPTTVTITTFEYCTTCDYEKELKSSGGHQINV